MHDASIGRTVVIGVTGAVTVTYEFNGVSWTQRTTTGTGPLPWGAVGVCFHDSSRNSIFWAGTTATSTTLNQTYELTGTSWAVRTTATASVAGALSGGYRNPSRNVGWVLNFNSVWEITLPSFDWVEYTTSFLPGTTGGRGCFDTGRSVPVSLVTSSGGAQYFAELVGNMWQSRGAITGTVLFDAIAYDAQRGVSVAFGANPLTQTIEWDGSTVTTRTFATGPSKVRVAAYDPVRKTIVVVDANNGSIWELGTYANQGAMCTTDAACLSGNCVDGRCCNVPCGGTNANDCQACSVAAGALTNGTCRTLPSTVTCRGSAGACDVAENCTGSSTACPADGFASNTTVCRAASMPCDVAETCPGNGVACPTTDAVADGTVVCRPSAGVCDVAESCNGVSKSCPADLKQSGVVCRSSQTACDAQELCDGLAAACPSDGYAPAGTICDAAGGVCDAIDHCTGSSIVCPEELAVDDTPCDDQNACTQASVCRTGVCTETLRLDCSDGNACTTDACQDSLGACVHTTIAACLADGGAADAGDVGDAGSNADAGSDLDSGTTPLPTPAAGCSCRVAGAPRADGSHALGWILAAFVVAFRRQSRRRFGRPNLAPDGRSEP